MNQKTALALGALAGAAATVFLRGRRPPARVEPGPPADPRAEELQERFAEARRAEVDEADFNAAGMGAETIVAEEPRRDEPPPAKEPPPANEFEAMRRRVHEEARAAAEEMRRRAETDA